jgi:hypothetical protein
MSHFVAAGDDIFELAGVEAHALVSSTIVAIDKREARRFSLFTARSPL